SARALADELLSPRQTELLELLGRFDGNGELRVRAAYHDQEAVFAEMVRGDPALAALRGRTDSASLLELGEAVAATYSARRQADADAIVSRLAEHALEVHVDQPTSEVDVVRASFLVPVRETAAFDAALESVALRNRHLIDFNCTGPVPPHSF